MNLKQNLRALKAALWLGWNIESNWADPWLFTIYSIIRPLAGLLIVFFVYLAAIAAGRPIGTEYLTYIVVGNSFFIFISQAIFNAQWLIQDERERFQSLKYIFASPANHFLYLIGRGAASYLVVASISSFITVAVSVAFLSAQIDVYRINYPMLALSLITSLPGIAALSIMVASVGFFTARWWNVGEGLSGVFLLLSGVFFPTEVLPEPLRQISQSLPTTHWLSTFRQSIVGANLQQIVESLTLSSVLTLVLITLAYFVFDRSVHYAKKKGTLDLPRFW